MQVGDIFTINDAAIAALEKAGHSVEWAVGQKENKKMFSLQSGMQFRIARNGLKLMPTELRASRLDSVSGKAIRGRPRKFPGNIVADLMGESLAQFSGAPVASQTTNAVAAATTGASSAVVNGQTSTDQPPLGTVDIEEQTEEEKRISQEKVEALFGAIGDDSTDDDWK
jgi:hypothetical protein